MERLDLDHPAPTLAAWSRTARPVHIGHLRETDVGEPRVRHARMTSWAARLDDILFGSSAAALLLVPLVVLPLAAWLP